jgi:hypothetical protein
MDITTAFLVSMGISVTGQVATEAEPVVQQQAPVEQVQAANRAEKTRKRIELTNNWTRSIRRSGMTEK